MAEMTVIRWRDIPMQVVVRGAPDGSQGRAMMPEGFQEAVDAAAMVAGLIGSDDYTEQMAMDRTPVGDEDPQATADAEVSRLLEAWDDETLKRAIRAGGVKGGPDVAGETEAVRPDPEAG
jgi:hypothetical protein